ncbi:DUF92 domain-containing protein [Pedobacter sp. HMF7056]|uniref:DUF92 domain-containing protein n=2 Tax=Hufsiella ginkgonis TaxID=2695274 RepID=A0A7K1Y014_9SPHI|nr:DUF92 domain-containing protein [Hufsiella ginkgonis]
MTWSIRAKKLTVAASAVGALLGALIFAAGGYPALLSLTVFFVMGTAATSWKKEVKRQYAPEQDHQVRRNAWQVVANAGVAGLLALAAFITSRHDLMLLMMSAAIASAAADTLSSELGTVYGRRFYHINSFRPGRRGADGVISLEGSLIGVLGAAVIAVTHYLGYGQLAAIPVIIIAGTLGNAADSVLGATLERRGIIGNNVVNFLNTLAAAIAACLFAPFM